MKTRNTRRMFLRGAAGFSLAIPFLPSLFSSKPAQAGGLATPKRFVAMGTNHGGIWQEYMYPRDASVLSQTQQYAGRTIRRGALPLEVANGIASISDVLSAPSTSLTSALAAKMNLLRGFDVPFYLAHHRGGHLGNYAENDGNGTDGQTAQGSRMPTIDQRLAWSPSFYPDLGTIKERSLVIGNNGMSANWTNPDAQGGEVQNITPENDSLALFNRIFVPPDDGEPTRALVVDRVLEDYKRLRNGNRRLSVADRRRLDDHIERIDELNRKLNVMVDCGSFEPPTQSSTSLWSRPNYSIDPDAHRQFWQLQNEVIAAAFSCDTCRVVTMLVGDIFSDTGGDWHQDVAHQANQSESQHALLWQAHQRFFRDVFVDLATRLDAIQDGEGTVLDNALIQWTHESGPSTHDPIEMPVVTAGSAAGFFTTGHYCDYRDLTRPAHVAADPYRVSSHIGLVYNQWLGNVLQSMGLSPSEYETGGNGGYGQVVMGTETWYAGYDRYTNADLSAMGDLLPFIT